MPETILQKKGLPVNAVITEPEMLPERWAVGASGIEYYAVNPTANWNNDLSTDERQNNGLETYTCTNFWGLNSLEIQLIYKMKNGLLTQKAVDFLSGNNVAGISYLDENGKPNFSEKWAAILTGTIYGVGNYVYKTPELARTLGLIPEAMLPFGNPKTWEEFIDKKQLTQSMYDLGEEFKNIFLVEYENIPTAGKTTAQIRDEMNYHRRQAPLSVSIPICSGYATSDIVKACTKTPTHCVGETGFFNTYKTIYDSYSPFLKKLAPEYLMPSILKSVITEKGLFTPVQIAEAKRFALSTSKSHNNEVYLSRVEAHGEAYFIDNQGGITYKHQYPGQLMNHMLAETHKIIPISEKDWNTLKPAEIK